jgi:putative endonuclease
MYKNNKVVGNFGEKIAEEYLEKNNLEILDKNFYCRQGEIDIIARDKDKDELVFVEVKTRTSRKYGTPAEAVHKEKRMHIYKAARYYIHLYRLEDVNIRFDVVEILVKNQKCFVNHIKQIM